MRLILMLSEAILPLTIAGIVLYGLYKKVKIYDVFVEGARDGMKTVVGIMPTLIGLMMAVGMIRASGFLDFLAELLSKPAQLLGFPAPLIPVALVRLFSSSAATGLTLDIFKEYGTDSLLGLTTSIMMSCTETIFYTMSVYFMAAKVRGGKPVTRSRWTLPGALIATFAGVAVSVILAGMMVAQ